MKRSLKTDIGVLAMVVVLGFSIVYASDTYRNEPLMDGNTGTTWKTHAHTSAGDEFDEPCNTDYYSDSLELNYIPDRVALWAYVSALSTGAAARYDADSIWYTHYLYNSWDNATYTLVDSVSQDLSLIHI